jgi:hypothetical protein
MLQNARPPTFIKETLL